MKGVELTKMMQELNLKNATPDIDMSDKIITTSEINRPALQLAGYLAHFDNERVQIIGYVEYTYLQQMSEEERHFTYERFISSKIPCVIFSTMTTPTEDMLKLAVQYEVPTFITDRNDVQFYGRADSVAGRETSALHFYSWCACGRLWRGCADHW